MMSKKKVRLNVVDAIIIVLVLALIAAAVYVLFGNKLLAGSSEKEKKKISFVLQVSELRDIYLTNLSKDEDAYEADSGKYLGKIVSVSSEVATRMGTDRGSGAQVISEIEGTSNLFVTIENEAEYYEGRYLVEGIPIVVGSVVTLVTPNLVAPANIISVEIID